jgi:hypothetical protein
MKSRKSLKKRIEKSVRKSMLLEGYSVKTSVGIAEKIKELKTRYVIQVSSR